MSTNVGTITYLLQGRYEIKNKLLVNTSKLGVENLVIGTRKKPTPTKSTYYLLLKLGKQYTYVSSMYPTDLDYKYEIEYKSIKYTMQLIDGNYVINPLKK
jgi:hypothetical protein